MYLNMYLVGIPAKVWQSIKDVTGSHRKMKFGVKVENTKYAVYNNMDLETSPAVTSLVGNLNLKLKH